MSVYGLDVIVTNDRIRILNEINGIRSGMGGFQKVYGDNRVEERVWDLLRTEHGDLTINDGTYRRNEFKKAHPVRYAWAYLLVRTPLIRRLFSPRGPILRSKKAETAWLSDQAPNTKCIDLPFDIYDGQESTVINVVNEELPHPTVNPLVAEGITGNKFLQYLLLCDAAISGALLTSSLVGLGATHEEELEKMLSQHQTFVVKPILGFCGKGIEFLSKDEVHKKYGRSRGPIDEVRPIDAMIAIRMGSSQNIYIEDLIDVNNYSFEPAVSIIQPFVDSRQNGEYSVIRAIVCNGKFVDAYERRSPNRRVNLSQDATAHSFDYASDFAHFCEEMVKAFEDKSKEHAMDTYQQTLYQRYIEKRGRTSERQRDLDEKNPFANMIDAMTRK